MSDALAVATEDQIGGSVPLEVVAGCGCPMCSSALDSATSNGSLTDPRRFIEAPTEDILRGQTLGYVWDARDESGRVTLSYAYADSSTDLDYAVLNADSVFSNGVLDTSSYVNFNQGGTGSEVNANLLIDDIEIGLDMLENVAALAFERNDAGFQTDEVDFKVLAFSGLSYSPDGVNVYGLNGRATLPGFDETNVSGQYEAYQVYEVDSATMSRTPEIGAATNRLHVALHEKMHSLGVLHSHQSWNGVQWADPGITTAGENVLDNDRYTVMSYERGGLDQNSQARTYGYSATPMVIDIAILRNMYGSVENHSGDTTYALTDPGTVGADFYGDDGAVSIGRAFYAIADTGGTDEITYSGARHALINLNNATMDQSGDTQQILDIISILNGSGLFSTLLPSGSGDELRNDLLLAEWHAGGFGSRIFDSSGAADLGGYYIAADDYADAAHFTRIENATGSDQADILVGNAESNLLTGNGGGDLLIGSEGMDTILGGAGADEIDGGDDADDLQGGTENDTIRGGEGNDLIRGDAGDDTLWGEGGDDTIEGGAGADSMDGGAGDFDRLSYENSSVAVNVFINGASSGGDADGDSNTNFEQLQGSAHNDTLRGQSGDDTILGGTGSDLITGQSGRNRLEGEAGNDVFQGGSDSDTILGGADNDAAAFFLSGDDSFDGGEGNDTLQLEDSQIIGTSTLEGGIGDDWFVVLSPLVTALDFTNATMSGWERLYFSINTNSNTSLTFLASQFEFDTLQYSSNSVLIDIDIEMGALTTLDLSAVSVTGNRDSTDTVTVTGDGDSEAITALPDDTELNGAGGNDTLTSGLGDDTLIGGTGNDLFVVNGAADVVTEVAGQGTDTIQSSISFDLSSVTSIEALELTGAADLDGSGDGASNTITGNGGSNTLNGRGGNDTLIGGLGSDTFDDESGADRQEGGLGDDRYDLDDASDQLIELAGEGTDTVVMSLAADLWRYSQHIENIEVAMASEGARITANARDNLITGDGTGTELVGAFGTDTLLGQGGNDTLDGGVGTDSMVGGMGDDVFVVDNVNDTVVESAGEGTDEVRASISYDLSAIGQSVEHLTLSGSSNLTGSGTSEANRLTGNSGNNTLDGGLGDDTLIGGNGDDTFDDAGGADRQEGGQGNDRFDLDHIDDELIEFGGQGQDTVVMAIATDLWRYSNNIEAIEVATTIEGARISGNGLDNHILGNTTGTWLRGNFGTDTIEAGAGNDTLEGGTGVDSLVGGTGDDVYIVDNIGDTIVEAVGEGTDEVQSSISFDLRVGAQSIEHLTLTGSASLSGIGNSDANRVSGNTGDNALDGGFGDDTLIGGNGNDTFADADGADRQEGGRGDDRYDLDDAGDVLVEFGGQGTDTVVMFIEGDLWRYSQQIENIEVAVANAGARIAGNGMSNFVTGNAVGTELRGNAGNDTLDGAGGNDVLVGGSGADAFRFSDQAGGLDTIVDFAIGFDRIEVDADLLGGLATGSLASVNFHSGAAPLDTDDRVIYDPSTGDLSFDLDGSGTVFSTTVFATLTGTPSLSHTEFSVI